MPGRWGGERDANLFLKTETETHGNFFLIQFLKTIVKNKKPSHPRALTKTSTIVLAFLFLLLTTL